MCPNFDFCLYAKPVILYLSNRVMYEQVKVGGKVQNKGWTLEHVDHKDVSIPEEIRIRGFRVNKHEQLEKNYTEPDKFSLEP